MNLGVWLPTLAGGSEKPDIWSAHWRQRIGTLMPDRADRWWDVASETEGGTVAMELNAALKDYGFPALQAVSTTSALVQLWRSGQSPGLTERQRERFLARLTNDHNG